MKKSEIEIGAVYTAKVSGKITQVHILAESPYGGWEAQNIYTGRHVHIRGAQRLRALVSSSPQVWAASS